MFDSVGPRLVITVFTLLAAFLAGRFVEFSALPLGAIAVAALAASVGVTLARAVAARTP